MITDWLLGLPPLLVYLGLFAVVGAESAGLLVRGEVFFEKHGARAVFLAR